MCTPDDPTGHDCVIAQSLRERVAQLETELDDLHAEIARLRGLTRLPGAVTAAHRDTTRAD